MAVTIKSEHEIELMRESGKRLAIVHDEIGKMIRPGISTWELDKKAYELIKELGGTPNFLHLYGYPATICASVNEVVVHGIPGKEKILREGDIVSIDLGAVINGFHGDNAYTFRCGKVSEAAERLCRTTEEALYIGLKQAVAGNRLGDIGSAICDYCTGKGYGVVREYTGHGVGTHLHEDPSVPNYGKPGKGARLLPGMTIAIEPMINEGTQDIRVLRNEWTVVTADGKLSAHFEHTVAITDGDCVILTKV